MTSTIHVLDLEKVCPRKVGPWPRMVCLRLHPWGVILCYSWKRRKFLFGSVRENVRKNAPEPNKNIRQSIFYASFGSDRRSYSCSGASVRVLSVRENVRKNATEPNKNIRQSIFFASFESDRRSYEQNYVTPCIVRLRLHSGILIFQRRRFSKCEKNFPERLQMCDGIF